MILSHSNNKPKDQEKINVGKLGGAEQVSSVVGKNKRFMSLSTDNS